MIQKKSIPTKHMTMMTLTKCPNYVAHVQQICYNYLSTKETLCQDLAVN